MQTALGRCLLEAELADQMGAKEAPSRHGNDNVFVKWEKVGPTHPLKVTKIGKMIEQLKGWPRWKKDSVKGFIADFKSKLASCGLRYEDKKIIYLNEKPEYGLCVTCSVLKNDT